MAISLGDGRRFFVQCHECRRRPGLSCTILAREQFALVSSQIMRNKRQRRQAKMAANIVRGPDRVIKEIKQERESDARGEREQESDKDIASSSRADLRCSWCRALLLNIIRTVGRESELLLLLLRCVGVEQPLVCVEIAL